MRIGNIINKIRLKSREKKWNQLLSFLKPSSTDTMLDVGVANIDLSYVDNFLIKNYPHRHNITAIGIGDLSKFRETYPNISTVSYDGEIFPFSDDQFDIAHSNAVIEHVGPPDAQKLFLSEMVRVSKCGMITTPNKYFPIEMHSRVPLLHWLDKSKFDNCLRLIGKDWASGDYMYLISENELRSLVQKIELKNYLLIKNRFLGFTMTFTLIWFPKQEEFE